MGRSRVVYELIPNESVRRATFRKRRAGLLKKLEELTTLCGVMACAVIFSAYDDQPQAWPSSSEASDVIEEFNNSPANRQKRYMMDQEMLLSRNISKVKLDLEKQRWSNQSKELDWVLAQYMAGNEYLPDVSCFKNPEDLIHLVKENISSIDDKIDAAIKRNAN
ncbi:hypothetical protein Tsubulata_023274 [Turnera subulata]|uniref:MADS-box domain-containing protein n=1 Tax=Turnera subulata TaxID=218843 RepID=A0A9Q0FIC3_9ROSI|nr:hypothetical protein Tsubulata_023274 [Turnera subulata]